VEIGVFNESCELWLYPSLFIFPCTVEASGTNGKDIVMGPFCGAKKEHREQKRDKEREKYEN
jgi:hypothetical protein